MNKNKPIKSNRKNKKFSVISPKGKQIHYGDTRYKDFTQHGDKKRQASYCKRAAGITNKKGQKTFNNPETANYYAYRHLWLCNKL